ncbi:HU family DNA-binding protein [Hoylesella marshii]|uniref:HU family DNA-binding protein n=1 Tax=Hoylesella marshii TaxID=189722 RepID=UPI0028D6AB58|nr:HU family DNA-binding protein [Hoylesella marshii]
MNNKDFITELSRRSGYTPEDTQKLIHTLIDGLCDGFDADEPVVWAGFGTFEVKKRLERVITNPSTGQKMLIPPKLVLNFKPVSSAKERLKKGGDEP